jgi:hypothetical protein
MNNICKVFNDCSNDILNWLTKQPEVKEESMTDRFLFDISEKLPIVKYKQFTRMEEGRKTGADWEWWFLFPNDKAFCARVQAKKLKNDKDNYAGIAYTTNGMLQIERLLDDSSKNDYASLYAFYSTESSKHTLCGGRKGNEGVFISDAEHLKNEIIDKPRAKHLAQDILKYSNPISCLFCCHMTERLTYDGLKEHLRRYFPTLYDNKINSKNDNNTIGFVKIPNRITQFLNKESDSWWENEFRQSIENVNAILVIDLRNG